MRCLYLVCDQDGIAMSFESRCRDDDVVGVDIGQMNYGLVKALPRIHQQSNMTCRKAESQIPCACPFLQIVRLVCEVLPICPSQAVDLSALAGAL
jgi:hypothetical protein